MKKILCFVLILLFTISIPTISFAGYSHCDYHPDAPKVWHDEIHYVDDVSDSEHRKVWCHWYTCSVCDDYIGTGGDIYREEYEPHSFFGSACIDCGHHRDNTPTQDELQAEAIQRINKDGDKIIGMQAIVKHAGNLRCEASKYADSFRKVAEEESFEIQSYTFVNGNAWLKVRCGNSSAWISASLVEISGKGDDSTGNPGVDQQYIGMRCRVIVNSGRARMGAGTEYPIIEYIGYNDEFRINDVGYASDGTLWFQIMKDGNRCWVSSTLVAVEGYYGR